jgi:hypothetical protein
VNKAMRNNHGEKSIKYDEFMYVCGELMDE